MDSKTSLAIGREAVLEKLQVTTIVNYFVDIYSFSSAMLLSLFDYIFI